MQGMILLSELSRRRIRSINKLIRVGRTEPVVVIRFGNNSFKYLVASATLFDLFFTDLHCIETSTFYIQ
jgi:hypothetical protein